MICDRCRRPADDVIVIWSPQGHRFYCDPCAKIKKIGPYEK